MQNITPDGSSFKVLLTLVISALVFGGLAGAATDSNPVSTDVTVNAKTIVDITPTSVQFSGDPGTTSTIWDNFTIENVGSTDILQIWANVTQPGTDPFGTGVSSNYDAGNMIGLRNTTGSGSIYVIDRKEFNSTVPPYVTMPAGCTDMNASGRIRLDNEEFFFCAEKGGGGAGYANGTIYISQSPHNETNLGDVDLSDNVGTVLSKTDSDLYGAADITLASNPTEDYCVALRSNGNFLRLIGWNTALDTAGACNNDRRIYSGTLNPGQTMVIGIGARIPYGVAQGALSQGTLRIVATT